MQTAGGRRRLLRLTGRSDGIAYMSSLSYMEKRRLEELFGMASGYVLNFSNRTFAELMAGVAGIDIYDDRYAQHGTSKANRLRAFWTIEDDSVVASVLAALLEVAAEQPNPNEAQLDAARAIASRIKSEHSPHRAPVRPAFAGRPTVPTPRPSPSVSPRRYDVALSFAGEQRPYVQRVARALEQAKVAVFYDEFEDLWGKDLAVELERVYHSGARYTVIFVSREYVAKPWTNHERQHALAGRIERRDDSVLPVQFDPTRLPGLPSTIAYLDISNMEPEQLAARIVRKLTR